MRIKVITFSRAQNYGAVLQTYALWRYLSNCGHDAELIDYITERCAVNHPDFVEKRTRNSRFWGRSAILSHIWKLVYLKKEQEGHEHFFSFLRERVPMTHSYYSNEELKNDCPEADLYITGSDQVWNTDFTWDHKIDLPYFMDFVPNGRFMISYASSLGRDNIDFKAREDIYNHLKRYHAVSVRELSAQKMLNDIGIQAQTVLDPTFLCPVTEWGKLIQNIKKDKDYLLVFLIHPNKKLVKLSEELASRLNVNIKVIVSSMKNQKKLGFGAEWPKVLEWLEKLWNADFVITDSFHATAFSLQFHKSFLVDGTVKYNTRISNILERLELPSRSLNELKADTAEIILKQKINYVEVDNRLTLLIEESKKWLNDQLEEAKIL